MFLEVFVMPKGALNAGGSALTLDSGVHDFRHLEACVAAKRLVVLL